MTTHVQNWCAAVGAAHTAGNLTRAARDVLFKLARLASRYRSLFPSHDWLAAAARCCRKTVVRALAQAQGAGLITWRPQRWLNARGWRRGTNVYRLTLPPTPLPEPMGHSVPQGKQDLEEDAHEEVVLAIVEADGRQFTSDHAWKEAAKAALERVRLHRAKSLGIKG